MTINHLDHLVLTVHNIAATCAFYERVVGMKVEDFGDGRAECSLFGIQKINLHEVGKEFDPKVERPKPGSR